FTAVVILISAVAPTSVLIASGLGCTVILIVLLSNQLSWPASFLAPVISLLAGITCAWIASRPIFDSLSMALNSARDSIRVRDELREQRRQLAQSVKALDEALYRVSRLNASLIIARQQAEEARQLKVRFANMISHEIRTPLNIIISFSEVIANAPESYGLIQWPEHLRDDVNEIYRSGRHLLNLINDVLDLAQVEANRVILKRERVSILEVVDQAVGLASKWFDHAGLYLRVKVNGEIPALMLDRIRIRQVILNLLSNARHYTTVGGVTVRLDGTADEVVVCVMDTGKGISPDNLAHLFDEFQHSGETVDSSIGSGLGLSISKMFVGLHGGRMWAESSGIDGEGTAVYFSIPLPASNTAMELPQSQRDVDFWQSRYDQARSERNILVASDETTVLRMASRLFGNQGKVVRTALGTLLSAVNENSPDVILAFTKHDQPYTTVMNQISDNAGDIPVISCRLEHDIEVEEHQSLSMEDINAWLLKPVSREDLAATIRGIAPNAKLILSVEDDLSMARFYDVSVVGDRHYLSVPTIVNVTLVSEVIPKMEERLPDVILLDLNLTDGSGWDVLEMIRARWTKEQVPVIIITAMDRYGLPALRAGEIKISNARGFSQRQTVMCLQNVLDAVLG
ncbi:MAG TPA: hybrid sensor histidine kinase/response regulator, partial [Anaerolineae bacterium]